MKKLLILTCSLLLFACGNSDKETILGKWHLYEVYENGELEASLDPSKKNEILGKQIARYNEIGMGLEIAVASVNNRLKEMKEHGFEFTEDLFFEFKKNDTKSPKNYKINEAKHVLEIMNNGQILETMPYSIDGNNLVLTIGKTKIILEKM